MVTAPVLRAVTRPVSLTRAMELLLELHLNSLLRFSFSGYVMAVSCSVSPSSMVADGALSTIESGAGRLTTLTVSSTLTSLLSVDAAVMTAVPALCAVMKPF